MPGIPGKAPSRRSPPSHISSFLRFKEVIGSGAEGALVSILVRTYSVQSALAGRQQPPTAPASPCGGEGVGGGPR